MSEKPRFVPSALMYPYHKHQLFSSSRSSPWAFLHLPCLPVSSTAMPGEAEAHRATEGSPSPAPAPGEQGRAAGTGARGGKRLSAAPASMVWYGHPEKKQNGDSGLLLFLLELFLSIPNNIYESFPPQLALKKSTLLSFCWFCPLGHEFYHCTCPRRESLWMSRYTGTGPKIKIY